MPRIEKLSLSGFRGASKPVDVNIDATKPLAIIFGENGTGKSSIIDGIDFVCNKQFGSVRTHSGTRNEHVISFKCASDTLTVCLTSDSGQHWTGKLNGGEVSVSGSGTPPVAKVLRRSKITEFIDKAPGVRYEALKAFLALPGIEDSEESLKNCLNDIESDINSSAEAKAQADTFLHGSWEAEGKADGDPITWAEKHAKKDSSAIQASIRQAKDHLDALTKAQAAVDSYTSSVKSALDAKGKYEKAHKGMETSGAAAQESDLIDILESAKRYLPKSSTPEKCPLCERPGIDVGNLISRIDARIQDMKRTKILKQELETAKEVHKKAAAVWERDKANIILTGYALAKVLRVSSLPEIAKLSLDWAQYPSMAGAIAPAVTDVSLKEAQRLQIAAKAALEPIKLRQEHDAHIISQLDMIKRSLAAVESNAKKAKELEDQQKLGKTLLKILADQRKDYVDQVLAGISTEVGNLCDKIHPGEGIKVKFFLDPKKRASAEMSGAFGGENVPPQAYYSESHLDTLGVCVFLALTKRFQGKDAIVVLDDVVTSVDAPHMDRFMNMLIDETDNFTQVIIATHYRPWLEKFRHARGHTAKAHIIHLSPWSLVSGIRSGHAKLAVQELRDIAAAVPFDRSTAANKTGIFLESLLDQLALLYECKVPRKPIPEYTLGELMESFSKRLLPLLKTEMYIDEAHPITMELKPLLEGVSSLSWIRNQVGCHWNLSGFDVPDADVLKFVQKTLELSNAIICPKCGSLPTKGKTGTYWQCHCKENKGLRLYPLESEN